MIPWLKHQGTVPLLALALPLLVRLYADGADVALQRVALLVLVFGVAYGWSAVFQKRIGDKPQTQHLHFAMLFALLLPTPVGWGGVLLAASFGWVFGREIFGAQPILSPALIALTFAIFSFPEGGFEAQQILSAPLHPLLALACLPGAAWLLWNKALAWPVIVGAALGVGMTAWLMASPAPLDHFIVGTLSVGIVFIAAAPAVAPRTPVAQWAFGTLAGTLIVILRLANPDQPDGVVFAILLASLFAPLLDRALSWRGHHAKP